MIKSYLIALLLAGCTITPKTTPPVSMYDFGPIPSIASIDPILFSANIRVEEISAPTWLNTQSIRYRLAYHNPAQAYAYANSRWVAPPAKLLTERIKQHLSGQPHQVNEVYESASMENYLLKIELEEFVQIFENQSNSRVKLSMRVSLLDQKKRSLIARQKFSGELLTMSADAAGAVTGFIKISDKLSGELIQWVSSILKQKNIK